MKKNNTIREKLDFTFSYKDFDTITELLELYLSDRITAYQDIFENDYTEDDKNFYIHYFIYPFLEDEDIHPYIYRIQHFLNREYELFNHTEINSIIVELQDIFGITQEQIEAVEDFEEFEFNNIEKIYELWEKLYEEIKNYPLLDLKDYNRQEIDKTVIFSDPATDSFVLDTFYEFLSIMQKNFRSELMRLDSFIFCDPEYIEFVAGEGTMAFFTSDNVFMPCYVEEDQRHFFAETIFHEFGHFIFDLLSETDQVLWYDFYNEWLEKGLELTREEGNEVEELFADVFSIIFNPHTNDFLHSPSDIIINTFIEIIKGQE